MRFFPWILAAGYWLLGIESHTLHAQSDNPAYSDVPMFRARTDASAREDAQSLRQRLSRMQDSLGPVNVLGDYVRPTTETNVKEGADTEAERKPSLEAKPNDYSTTSSHLSDAVAADKSNSNSLRKGVVDHKGILLLPGPTYTMQPTLTSITNMQSMAARDGFRPSRIAIDPEAAVAPALSSPVSFASANVPAFNPQASIVNYYPNFQLGPEFPGGAGGITSPTAPVPVPQPGFPPGFPPAATGEVMPNAGAPILPSVPMQTAPPPAIINSPTAVAPMGSSIATPNPTYVNPVPTGITPGVIGSPIGATPGVNPTVAPIPMYPAPTPYYPAAPLQSQVAPPVGQAIPLASPSDNALPRYPRSSSVVNGAPFVSPPPCQFDASYMVSPRAYRPNVDNCGPAGYAPSPYATRPTGSPFSYVPPTAMPPVYRNAPYPVLLGFGQNLNNAYLSRGIIGQPTAYVDGQPIRNFLRYLSP
jgi:hypothetical protein